MKKPATEVVASGLRLRRRLGILGATFLGVAAFAAPAHAAGIGAHAPVDFASDNDPFGHFPSFYEDNLGQQVQLCLDPADAACGAVLAPDPSQPVRFSATVPADNNFPDEAFYQRAQTTVGNIQLTVAQESTYDGTDGTQGVFGRVRIRDLGPDLAAGWYRFTYPGGAVDLEADPAGRLPINYSSDVGCGPAIGAACDSDEAFTAPGASDIGATFLQKDRGAGSAPPAGYLGDAGAPEAVVGSSFVPAGETEPANYFRVEHISGPGGTVTGLVGENDQFTLLVPGKLASGSDPAGILVNSDSDFGGQRVDAPMAKLVSLRNGGSGKVDIQSLAIAGPNAAQFELDTSLCNGGTTTLEAGQSCNVLVTFTPDGTGPRQATIEATQANGISPPTVHSFPLLGRGILPVLSLPSLVSFGNQLVDDTIGPRTVEVGNTGTDTMHVNAAQLGGAEAGQYTLGLNTCNAVDIAPGETCTVAVFFRPTAGGSHNALLNVSTDVGTKSVAITGAGVTNPGEVTVIDAGDTTVAPAAPAAQGPLAAPVSVPVTASALPKLSLKSLGGAPRVKRAKAGKTGIRLALRVQDGTEVVRIKVYRRTAGGRKLLSDGFKTIGGGSIVHVAQSHAALRHALRILGRYEVEVTPGRSTSDLGNTSKFAFQVVK